MDNEIWTDVFGTDLQLSYELSLFPDGLNEV